MAMIDFAFLAVKVLVFIWAVQLIWIGSYLLKHRFVPTPEDTNEEHRPRASITFLNIRKRHRSELFFR
jgi:hypothetical protein